MPMSASGYHRTSKNDDLSSLRPKPPAPPPLTPDQYRFSGTALPLDTDGNIIVNHFTDSWTDQWHERVLSSYNWDLR